MCRQSFPPVLLTRPLAQSQRFAAALKARFAGIAVHHAPLIAPIFRDIALPDKGFAAVIFTSETGVEACRRLMAPAALPRRAFCVGGRTAEAARAAGFDPLSAEGDVHALAALIRAARPTGPLLHLRGADAAGDLAGMLRDAGLQAEALVLYDQQPQALPAAARDLLTQPGPLIVPLFSPRTARIFVAACRNLPLRAALRVAVISQNAADAVAGLPVAALEIAATPDAAGMEAAVARLVAVGMQVHSH